MALSQPPENLDPDDERALIECVRAGDGKALEMLLEHHQHRVFRTACGLCRGDEDAAREITGKVLESAWRNLAAFRGESRLSTWFHTMTVNFFKNHVKSSGRRARHFVANESLDGESGGASILELQPDTRPSPREVAAANETQSALEDLAHELPEEFRVPLQMRFLEDLSYDEISEALGIPVGTVKSRINRARKQLREAVQSRKETSR